MKAVAGGGRANVFDEYGNMPLSGRWGRRAKPILSQSKYTEEEEKIVYIKYRFNKQALTIEVRESSNSCKSRTFRYFKLPFIYP